MPSLRILVDDVVIERRLPSVAGLVSNSECVEDRNMPAKPLTLFVLFLGLPACGSDSPASTESPGDLKGFEVVGKMTISRFLHVAVQLKNGQVLIAGGTETDRPAHSQADMYHDSAEIFDPEGGTSSKAGNLSQARIQDSAVLLRDGRVLIKGGPRYPPEIYDPQSGGFAVLADAPELRRSAATTVLSTGDIFATDVGGNAGIVDADTWKFTSTGRMITPRTNHSATLLQDGGVLIAGGMNAAGMVKTSEIYDPATNSFAAIGDLNDERRGHDAMLLQDGRVLVIGGRRGNIEVEDVRNVTTAEMFDPVTGMFAPAGDTGLSSIDSAYLLPTGKVFLLSGRDVAIYDPVTGTTTRTGHNISENRSFYIVTPLNDGRIMLSGGLKDRVSTDEVLVYSP